MANYKQAKVKVIRVDGDRHKFIVEFEDKLYQVPQLLFQRECPKPDFIDCIYYTTSKGGVYLAQNIRNLIGRFYSVGDEADFRIRFSQDDNFILEDKYGFTAFMERTPAVNPALTPNIRCKILCINARSMEVRLIKVLGADSSEFSVSESDFCDMIGDCRWNTSDFYGLVFGDSDIEMFNFKCNVFIQNIATSCSRNELPSILSDIKSRCLSVLSTPNFLPVCNDTERCVLEKRLSDVIEQAGYCLQALSLVDENSADKYVENTLSTLSDSAYIYHPLENFGIMQSIFIFDAPLMERMMPRILSTVRSQSPSLWMRPPFQRQWIKLLQLYIGRTYHEFDRLASDCDTRETMINVLVLELTLAKNLPSTHFDSSINLSTLYRLVSLMNVSEPDKTLQKAFLSLFCDDEFEAALPFDGDDAFIIANRLCSQLRDDDNTEDFDPVEYVSDKARLLVNTGEITLEPLKFSGTPCQPLPSLLKLWHGLNIVIDGKVPPELRLNQNATIEQYRKLWDYIDIAIFDKKDKTQVKSSVKCLDVDDQTQVIVTRRLRESLLFECEIVNDDVQGYGTLDVLNDCSPYYPGDISVSTFQSEGRPLVLDVYIKAINSDGTYVFAMKDYIIEYMEQYRLDKLGYDSVLTCIVNQAKAGAKCVPAISSEGLSVSIEPADGMTSADLPKGLLVDVSSLEKGTNGFVSSRFVAYSDTRHISIADAFHRLLLGYTGGEVYDNTNDKISSDTILSVDARHVTELMNIIETKATIENDNLLSYNYLCFCKLLAILLNDNERQSYYTNRLYLLEVLNDFAIFDKISTERIKCIADGDIAMFERNVSLKHDFEQLRVIGCIDTDDYYDYLYHCSLNNEDPQLQQLSSLVMAHNTVKKAGLLSQAGDILDKIRALLKLNKTHSNKKNYGNEDFHTEFKTSIIYPETSMRVDIKEQRFKIMQEICAFLNAEGGTLYIGVSDIGYEMGIYEDLKHQLFRGSKDKYEVYVCDCIAHDLGQIAAHYVHTHFDDTVNTDVLIIDIEPCPTPVMLDGEYYERMGTSARRVNESYRESFLALRAQWAIEHGFSAKLTSSDESLVSNEDKNYAEEPSTVDSINENNHKDEPYNDTYVIQTSRIRNNIIHDYEDYDNYRPVIAIICILDNDNFKILNEDDYQPALLKLAIHDEEVNGWLMMVYSSGNVCRISISDILERDRNRLFKRLATDQLIFASVALDSDSLCIGYSDSKGNRYVRFDDVFEYDRCGMQDSGSCLVDCSFETVHYVEIVPQSNVFMSKSMSRKTLGCNLKSVEGRKCIELLPGLD